MYYVHRNILYVTLCRQNISQYFNHIKRRMLRTETTEVHQCHSSVSWQNYVMLIIPSGASLVAQRVKHLPAMQETWVQSLGQEDPLEKGNGNPLQYSCLEIPMDREAC